MHEPIDAVSQPKDAPSFTESSAAKPSTESASSAKPQKEGYQISFKPVQTNGCKVEKPTQSSVPDLRVFALYADKRLRESETIKRMRTKQKYVVSPSITSIELTESQFGRKTIPAATVEMSTRLPGDAMIILSNGSYNDTLSPDITAEVAIKKSIDANVELIAEDLAKL